MMRTARLLALTGLATALLPLAPSHATPAVGACDDGYTGVVVTDSRGEVARSCVRTSDVALWEQWVDDVVHIKCWVYFLPPDARCEVPPPPIG
jgi:hypothetical protein